MGSEETLKAEISALSFEEALGQLEGIVGKLESGSVNLEESIEIYTRGTLLKQHCQDKLKQAEARIEKLTIGDQGPTGTEPLDVD